MVETEVTAKWNCRHHLLVLDFTAIFLFQFSTVENNISGLTKTHMRSLPFLRDLVKCFSQLNKTGFDKMKSCLSFHNSYENEIAINNIMNG